MYLVVNAEGLVGVLHQLVNGQSRIVGLDDGVRDLRGGDNGEGSHHPVWKLFADL